MKMLPTLVALAPLLALSPALAQDSSAMSAPSLALDSSAEATAGASLNGLLAALAAGSTTDLGAITEASVINLVPVSSLQPSETPDALDTALETNKAAVDKLRADAGANAAIAAKLKDGGYTADQVLAVVTETDGSISIYVDDRA